jgi:hypothetical protein
MLLHLRRASAFEIRFYSDVVIYSTANALLASKIALRGLNRDVPKKELDLFEFAPCRLAEPRTGPAQVVRSQVRNTSLLCRVLHDVPDRFNWNAITPRLPGSIDASEETPILDPRWYDPNLQLLANPIRNGNCPNVTAFTDQIDDRPTSLPLLQVSKTQANCFLPPQPTGQEQCEQRSIPLAFHSFWIGSLLECHAFFRSQPIPQSNTNFPNAVDAPNPRR